MNIFRRNAVSIIPVRKITTRQIYRSKILTLS
jgi:hypothetical protein